MEALLVNQVFIKQDLILIKAVISKIQLTKNLMKQQELKKKLNYLKAFLVVINSIQNFRIGIQINQLLYPKDQIM